MSIDASLIRPQKTPDILDVIAASSSETIPTPPLLAWALLDLLPAGGVLVESGYRRPGSWNEVRLNPPGSGSAPDARTGRVAARSALRSDRS